MAGHEFVELKNRYLGKDIYVIGSGPSAGFVDPEFFMGKITLGVNNVYLRFPRIEYVVAKERQVVQEACRMHYKVIGSRHHAGSLQYPATEAEGRFYAFEHEDNQCQVVNLDVIGTDRIVVSYSTITSAMHVAAYMGARNIILVGHDCGFLDGEQNIDGYTKPILPGDFYNDFLGQIEPQTLAVKARLDEVYGCRVYSLNPFVNFGLEGHRYVHA